MDVATLGQQQDLLEAFESYNANRVDKFTQMHRNLNLQQLFKEYEEATNSMQDLLTAFVCVLPISPATYESNIQYIDLMREKTFRKMLKPILEICFRRKI